MTNDGSLPTEEQLDEYFSTEDSEELEEVEQTPETGEEEVTLSQEEYDELKKVKCYKRTILEKDKKSLTGYENLKGN